MESTVASPLHAPDFTGPSADMFAAVGTRPAPASPQQATEEPLPVPTPQQPHTSLLIQQTNGSSRLARWNDSAWRLDAACAHMDTLIFFPVGETGPVTGQVELAKKICASCPVREQCLEFAIATIQNDGIWGGTTEDERRLIKRARRAAARRAAAQSAQSAA
jgi:WhiB family transcriptional regulator, redox-sensing transcriptional regulator